MTSSNTLVVLACVLAIVVIYIESCQMANVSPSPSKKSSENSKERHVIKPGRSIATKRGNNQKRNSDTEDNGKSKAGGANVKREQLFDKSGKQNGPKVWDHWGKWSQCTVTCGVGKITRWRHCVSGGCSKGEKEAQIKTCTMPAC